LPAYQHAASGNCADAAGLVDRGKQVFARACAECHGENGKGEEGGVGPINDVDFLAIISDQALRRIIITGRPDLGMPNYAEDDGRPSDFKPLSETEIDELVALLASWRTPLPESKKVASQR
jgi:mono/diheme cytochrome c family protein